MLSIPTENNVLYKRQEREIGKAVEKVARGSCLKNLILTRKIAQANSKAQNNDDFPGIAVSYDMGWQKRGKGHNSLIGQGAGMGVVTGKVLSYSTRCKTCRFCNASKKAGKVVKKSQLQKKSYWVFKNNRIGSSMPARCRAPWCWSQIFYLHWRWWQYNSGWYSSAICCRKLFIPRDLSPHVYTTFNQSKLFHFKFKSDLLFFKMFSYAIISQNVGEPENFRASLKCSVPHAFSNPTMCDISWCGFKKCPATYKHDCLMEGFARWTHWNNCKTLSFMLLFYNTANRTTEKLSHAFNLIIPLLHTG